MVDENSMIIMDRARERKKAQSLWLLRIDTWDYLSHNIRLIRLTGIVSV
jgi:hypothetical protein